MPCSICGKEGHNKTTCSDSVNNELIKSEKRDRALILRIDNMTEEEQNLMHNKLRDIKKEFTSNKATATLIEGKSSELPSKIKNLIKNSENNNQLLPLKKETDE